MGGGNINKAKLFPSLALVLVLLLLSGGRAGSTTEEKKSGRHLEGRIVGVPSVWHDDLYYYSSANVYLVWEAQEGATSYNLTFAGGMGVDNSLTVTGYEYLQPGMSGPAYPLESYDWAPYPTYEEAMQDAIGLARYVEQNFQYTWDIDPVCDYRITMDFEYMAGEPVITSTGTKADNIIMEHPLRFDPRDKTPIRIKIKFKDGNNNPLASRQFRWKIRYSQIPDNSQEPLSNFEFKRGGHNHLDDYDQTLLSNGVVSSYGRPLFHMHGNGIASSNDNGNIIREYYYRGVYNTVKTTDAAGEYQITFDPSGSDYGTIPTGGRMEFEVYYPDVNAATPAYNDYMEVYVPNLTRMNASTNGHYTLVGGTQEHPGPPLFSGEGNNWNHYATAGAVAWLTTLSNDFYAEHAKPLEYNDMFLPRGGKFEIGSKTVNHESVPAPFWALDSSHYEHYGYSADGNSCDFNFGNPRYITDDEIVWIEDYIDKYFPDLPSKKDKVYDEGDHLHFRIYDNKLDLEPFPDPTAYPDK